MGNKSSVSETRVATLETQVGGLDGSFGFVSTRVNTLENSFEAVSTHVNTLENSIGSVSTRVTSVEGSLGSRIDTLEKAGSMKVSGIDYNVVYVQNSLKTYAPIIDSLQTTATSYGTRIGALEVSAKSFDTLFGRVSAVETSTKSFVTQFTQQGTRLTALEALPPRVTNVENVIGTYDSRMAAFSTTASTFAARITALELSSSDYSPRIGTVETTVNSDVQNLQLVSTLVFGLNTRVATLEGLQGTGGNAQICIGKTCVSEDFLKMNQRAIGSFANNITIPSGFTVISLGFSQNSGDYVSPSTDSGIKFSRTGIYRIDVDFIGANGRGGGDLQTYYAHLQLLDAGTRKFAALDRFRDATASGGSTGNAAYPTVEVGSLSSVNTVYAKFPSKHYNGGGPYPHHFFYSFTIQANAGETWYFTFNSDSTNANITLGQSTVVITPVAFN